MRNHECATCGNEVEIAIETYCNACRIAQVEEENLIDDDTCQYRKKPECEGCGGEEIIATVAERCNCPEHEGDDSWSKTFYWTQPKGGYSECDEDGNHDSCDGPPTAEEERQSWLEYARYVAETGSDPLENYMVARTFLQRTRWIAEYRRAINGILVTCRRKGQRCYELAPPQDVLNFLGAPGPSLGASAAHKCEDFVTLEAVAAIAVEGNVKRVKWSKREGVVRVNFIIERRISRTEASVANDLKKAARRHIRQERKFAKDREERKASLGGEE